MFKSNSRYRFYQVHKYVSFELTELDRLIAKADFRQLSDIEIINNRFLSLKALMDGHSEFENKMVHVLLRNKGSTIHEIIETEHRQQHEQYEIFQNDLEKILQSPNEQERVQWGYEFYLNYRLFLCENLKHLYIEEAVIMPELQRLYSDDELRAVQANTYQRMTPEQMAHMISVLDPHISAHDREFFLGEMRLAEPEKFEHTGLTV